jgi:predicted MFS family arabinose efflux permease
MPVSWKVYILAIISFLVGTSEYIVSGILDRISFSFGVSLASAGQLITIFSLVYAICTPILMALTASMDRRSLILYGLGLFVAANLLSFVLPGYGLFVAARIIMALGAGIVVVTALNIAAKIAREGRQASSIATVVMGFTASLIIGVPLGRMTADAVGWKFIFIGIALLGLIAMLIIFLTIPRIKGDEPIPLPQQLALLKEPKVALGLAISFFWLGGYSIAYTYLSPYLISISGINDSYISGALLIFGIASGSLGSVSYVIWRNAAAYSDAYPPISCHPYCCRCTGSAAALVFCCLVNRTDPTVPYHYLETGSVGGDARPEPVGDAAGNGRWSWDWRTCGPTDCAVFGYVDRCGWCVFGD